MKVMVYALAALLFYATIAFGVVFQLFLRYQYIPVGNELWSVDRLTHETSKLVAVMPTATASAVPVATPKPTNKPRASAARKPGHGPIASRKHSASTSTSTSTSTSLH